MFKSLAVLSAVTAAAYAQTSGIPANISESCTTFFTNLNTNTQVQTCLSALNVALEGFAPGTTATASSSAITSALEGICSTNACPTNVISQQVTAFYSACKSELTSENNLDVIRFYDVLYVILPMKGAICSQGDDGKWCAMASDTLGGTSASSLQSSLYTQNGQTVIPNIEAFSENNVPFLLLKPSLEKEVLCKACTRNVLAAYINHESNVPYAPGLSNSQLLKSQNALYNGVKEKCGASFMDNQIRAAGGIGSNVIKADSNAAASADVAFQGLLAIAAGFATLAVQAAF